MFTAIVCYDNAYGISQNGKLPWKVPEDLKFFQSQTIGNVIIMGRKTLESIGNKPLKNRINIVLSKTTEEKEQVPGVLYFNNPLDCIDHCYKTYIKDNIMKVFVIGGAEIYMLFYRLNAIKDILATELPDNYSCDVKFPLWFVIQQKPINIIKTFEYQDDTPSSNVATVVHKYIINQEEYKMLNLMREILDKGRQSSDRTGTGTLSLFGKQLEFSLENNRFPLMTTRKMFFRGIFEELMLYLRGQTDNNILVKKGINVWTPNTTREFLDSRGLNHLPVGDMGHSYGFSFRHFGAEYVDCKTDYTGKGFDQLAYVIDEIKTNPSSRRMIISLWEPNTMYKSALPPCLYNYQFYCDGEYLTCMMTQRSSDFALAGGWNVATGALLTILIANVCGMKPEKLIWNIGDVHLYNNVIAGIEEQIKRQPNLYPALYIVNNKEKIEDFEFADLRLVGYNPQPTIELPMNV
jgi:dihydrofolate reductase/thymidylate synthase